MISRKNRPSRSSLIVFLLLAIAGCSSPDDRLLELSERSLSRQAEQNQQVAQQSTEVAKATRQLVDADAKARRELITAQAELQRNLHAERASLDRQHETLECQRNELAIQRHREPIVAAAIVQAAVLIACILPLMLCFFVLRALRREGTDAALGDLLVQELVDPHSLLLLENTLPSLPAPETNSGQPSLPHDNDL